MNLSDHSHAFTSLARAAADVKLLTNLAGRNDLQALLMSTCSTFGAKIALVEGSSVQKKKSESPNSAPTLRFSFCVLMQMQKSWMDITHLRNILQALQLVVFSNVYI